MTTTKKRVRMRTDELVGPEEAVSLTRTGWAVQWCEHCQVYCHDKTSRGHARTQLHIRNRSQGELE